MPMHGCNAMPMARNSRYASLIMLLPLPQGWPRPQAIDLHGDLHHNPQTAQAHAETAQRRMHKQHHTRTKKITLVLPLRKDVDRTCTGSLLQCPQNLLQSTHAAYYIHDDVGSAAEPDVVFSVLGVRRNELFVAAEAEWM